RWLCDSEREREEGGKARANRGGRGGDWAGGWAAALVSQQRETASEHDGDGEGGWFAAVEQHGRVEGGRAKEGKQGSLRMVGRFWAAESATRRD
ncbi:hypothetical protein SOVF_188870, partial [Spinacia oleracea]